MNLQWIPHNLFIILLTCPGMLQARGNNELTLDAFIFSSQKSAAQTWQAKGGSPPVQRPAAKPGLVFPCMFDAATSRVYWDRKVALDLSTYSGMVMDLSCDRPELIRKLAIYFKSGDGWYIWNKPFIRAGRQRLTLLKSDFAAEGNPAGWHTIEAIRIAPWKESVGQTSLTLYSLTARIESIVLVQGSSSIPIPGEKTTAQKVTQRISRWLSEAGVPHGVIDDTDVTDQTLAPARLSILPYNHTLPVRERNAFRRFLQRNGKLIVFFSADKQLAAMMNFKLAAKQTAFAPGRWSAMIFDAPGAQLPPKVHQESWNIRPALPISANERIIAYWGNMDGQTSRDPAWTESKHGLWMSHILLDGDEKNKKQMLLGLIGRYEPHIWPAAAQRALDNVGTLSQYKNLNETMNDLAKRARGNRSGKQIRSLLNQAETLYTQAVKRHEQKSYAHVIASCAKIEDLLQESYARLQQPKASEFVGVWDHQGTGLYPGNWERTCKELVALGVTAIFPNMLWGGIAHYKSKVLPRSNIFRKYGDQLAQCIQAARKYGMEVHAWKVCWNLNGAPAAFVEKMRRQGRLQRSDQGRELPWLNPAHPDNQRLALDALKEIAAHYDVDGVHLDYIRYPGKHACFSDASRKRFEAWRGKKAEGWPRSAQADGSLAETYRRFRVDQINLFVRSLEKELQGVKPGVKLSAAVYGAYPDCKAGVAQDWPIWVEKGYMDFVCPMNYTPDTQAFLNLIKKQLQLPRTRGKIYPGIGVTASESRLTPDRVIDQIMTLRQLGVNGFMLFDLDRTLQSEVLPMLRLGITK